MLWITSFFASHHITSRQLELASCCNVQSCLELAIDSRILILIRWWNHEPKCKRVAGQGLILEKEPINPFDPNAVRISTLSGAMLGYVPRGQTRRILHSTCFASVHHIGQVPENRQWGALVQHTAFP